MKRGDVTDQKSECRVPKLLMTCEEAAWSLGISRSKLYTMIAQGKVVPVKIGGNTLFRTEDLEAYARSLP